MRAHTALLLALAACGSSASGPPDDTDPRSAPLCPTPGAGAETGGIGDVGDAAKSPTRLVVLMGGSSEDDDASTRFVTAAGGGDVLVLRASGSLTSYPNYFAGTLRPAPEPASAVTALINDPAKGADAGVLCRVRHAEAIWLAGGDQWNYLGRWPAVLHDSLVAATARGVPMGGTSAGAMSLGEGVFNAEHGTVTSAEALADPLSKVVSVSLSPFPQPELGRTLVDSHFSERDREGRLLAFLARFKALSGHDRVVGLGLDERVAMVIEGGAFEVLGPGERAAFVYELSGSVELEAGRPLEADGIRRARLAPGSGGAWPPDLDALTTEALEVVGGVVSTDGQR